MKKYLFFYKLGGAGVGCEATGICYFEVEDPEKVMENRSVNQTLWEMACGNAESYGVYPTPDYGVEEDEGEYSDDIYGHAVPLDPEKHGCKLAGGGHWKTHLDEKGNPVFEDGYWVLDTSKGACAKMAKDLELKSVDECQHRLEVKLEHALEEAERIERERVTIEEEIATLKLKARKLVDAGAEYIEE